MEELAWIAMQYRGEAHHDTDVVVVVAGLPITVGNLRAAFERYFKEPFRVSEDDAREQRR